MQYPAISTFSDTIRLEPSTVRQLLIWGLLLASCAGSSTKQQEDADVARPDGKISTPDLLRRDYRPPRDSRTGIEGLHFWDSSSPTDRSKAPDTLTNIDQVSTSDRTLTDTVVIREAMSTADLSQGPNPGPVQCRKDSDCGNTLTCNMSAPGGICLGCGTCLGWLECYSGACVRDCYTDKECNVGFRCDSLDRCVLRTCDQSTPCPAPYTCGNTGTCVRPTCPTGSCPSPLVCINTLCIEP